MIDMGKLIKEGQWRGWYRFENDIYQKCFGKNYDTIQFENGLFEVYEKGLLKNLIGKYSTLEEAMAVLPKE